MPMGEGIHTASFSGPKSLQSRMLEGLLLALCLVEAGGRTLNSREADDGVVICLSPESTHCQAAKEADGRDDQAVVRQVTHLQGIIPSISV